MAATKLKQKRSVTKFKALDHDTFKVFRYHVGQLRFELEGLSQENGRNGKGPLPPADVEDLLERLEAIENTVAEGASADFAWQVGEDGLLSDEAMDAQDRY